MTPAGEVTAGGIRGEIVREYRVSYSRSRGFLIHNLGFEVWARLPKRAPVGVLIEERDSKEVLDQWGRWFPDMTAALAARTSKVGRLKKGD